MTAPNLPLGETQKIVLSVLRDRGSWHRNAGWHWNGPARTEKLLETLVKRGLVVREGTTYKLKDRTP
jgi:hypothetical protein